MKIGKDPLIQLLDAQRSFSSSIQAEADAVVSYNIAIAGFQFAKGTILEYNNDHDRRRAAAGRDRRAGGGPLRCPRRPA